MNKPVKSKVKSQKSKAVKHKNNSGFFFKALSLGFLLLLGTVFFAPLRAQELDKLEASSEKNIERAEELFSKLKKWQDEKDWENFFTFRDSYEEEVERLAAQIKEPQHLRLKAEYLLFRLKEFLGKKSKKDIFESFLSQVSAIKSATPKTLSFLKTAISELSAEPKRDIKRKLSSLYIKILKSSGSEYFLKSEAESFYLNEDLDNFVVLSKACLSLIEDKNQLKRNILNLIGRTSCDGFNQQCAPYFAEELFDKLDKDFDFSLNEDLLYIRGYNLERAFEYERALKIYEEFLKAYPGSLLFDEVALRSGFIYMYKLKDFDKAKIYFNKVAKRNTHAAEQLEIINKDQALSEFDYSQRAFWDFLSQEETCADGVLQVEARPFKAFIGEKIEIKSTSFLPETGCLAPEGLFLWSGDLGEVKITTNVPAFFTSFKKEGFKVLSLAERIPKGILGADAALINIYGLDISFKDDKDKNITFEAVIEPSLPEALLGFSWRIEKDNMMIAEVQERQFSRSFERSGDYALDLSIFFLGREIYTQRVPLVVK
ncbi:MAG: tetratricopeptide repeat protein [Candidatus Omnitrophica bacterium]|nr:tetratricopeptide repeat protein [Candidatus Omnitrophota bacterium]